MSLLHTRINACELSPQRLGSRLVPWRLHQDPVRQSLRWQLALVLPETWRTWKSECGLGRFGQMVDLVVVRLVLKKSKEFGIGASSHEFEKSFCGGFMDHPLNQEMVQGWKVFWKDSPTQTRSLIAPPLVSWQSEVSGWECETQLSLWSSKLEVRVLLRQNGRRQGWSLSRTSATSSN